MRRLFPRSWRPSPFFVVRCGGGSRQQAPLPADLSLVEAVTEAPRQPRQPGEVSRAQTARLHTCALPDVLRELWCGAFARARSPAHRPHFPLAVTNAKACRVQEPRASRPAAAQTARMSTAFRMTLACAVMFEFADGQWLHPCAVLELRTQVCGALRKIDFERSAVAH